METLQHLAYKGGYPKLLTQENLKDAKVQRYQSSKIHVSWNDYVKAKSEN